MPRFVARIPFNAEDLNQAKAFARKIRRVACDHADTGDEWAERDARLLRVVDPVASERDAAEAAMPNDAPSLLDGFFD